MAHHHPALEHEGCPQHAGAVPVDDDLLDIAVGEVDGKAVVEGVDPRHRVIGVARDPHLPVEGCVGAPTRRCDVELVPVGQRVETHALAGVGDDPGVDPRLGDEVEPVDRERAPA